MSGLPNITEVTRLISNVSKIITAYYKPADSPTLPNTLLTFAQVNDLEKMLYMIKHLIDNEEMHTDIVEHLIVGRTGKQ
jgi:hypothetical protein